ncbi:crosslink repair DNA glycosylase YcaQ family protein [Maritimibacter sp. UBA3975]|uniref:winged helix-turn-helix domain-containing protein n=1 Tax=Maritimibacter sp. UBA3975 TaxID=1946833 RepID=UPI000C090163|nr:crosslink repair DNA glycosylase YcaQ family protein [Maritimibacter sp. UBA3975]MAM63966.1 hypothetical protein [Maritimibacter sp.]
MTPTRLTNRDARRLWLAAHGLLTPPTRKPDVMRIIRDLGFLQIDTIRNVVRAQDHILWSRSQTYREDRVWRHLANRDLFEHFTHDASLIPREVLPDWHRQFVRLGARAARGEWYQSGLAQAEIAAIRNRIEQEGPLSTHAFDTKVESREMWARPPHKKALDQMWYAGTLATSHREGFVKFYDLGERVLGRIDHGRSEAAQADALHAAALARIGIASPGEIYRFWGATSPAEARDWIARHDVVPVDMACADAGVVSCVADPGHLERLPHLPEPSSRIRIINPFDPAFRDRARTERLFGFHYRNEMFVPQAKRIHGYYVYPLLEGDRFVGRLEAKADKAAGILAVSGFWPEPGVRWGAGRRGRLDAELDRFARFGGLSAVTWRCEGPGAR